MAKVVDARRGGFCYELNGAFAALLTALGFDVTLMQARVYDDTGRPGIPYDHLALRVGTRDGGDWLATSGSARTAICRSPSVSGASRPTPAARSASWRPRRAIWRWSWTAGGST